MAAVQWDPFAAIERDVRAMVADPRWADVPPATQLQAMAARLLRTEDGACWMFGAHARWYRTDGSEAAWHLSAPPAAPAIRAAARPPQPGVPIPEGLLPGPADVTAGRGSTQAFVGPDVSREVTERVRGLLTEACRPREDAPLVSGPLRDLFYGDVTAGVAAVWGTIMWCAYAPAFDGNEVLLSMFGEFLRRPLPGDDWVRWLPPMPLEALAALYCEPLGHGAQGAALRLVAVMADTARVLLPDGRFTPRAHALIAMLEPLLARPWLDHAARDAAALRDAWLARCPRGRAAAVLAETSPEDHFRHTLYDLVEALAFAAGDGADPRVVAASLLAADVHEVAPEAAARLYPYLDPELRRTYYLALAEPGHPLRGCWPEDGAPADGLRPPDRASAAALLGAGYATGLAWCGLTGTEPPARGFPASAATVSCLIGQRDDPLPAALPEETGPSSEATETSGEWIHHT
ncbi:hypothetical protein Ssi03_56540 [Sphaerisporangium siamense]|uniref:hypothetical protein n=1 Tax=Sphaerisporangium siamense TaxID=795645 RepID=UPI001A5069FD|nr:hypothetical protein [Sphaerisporangium siamense]GII87664.1 hypothetical protein Ssi03_56540 [Sphaerisporangium siamense]